MILNNFWTAVSEINPQAYEHLETTVLWAPIGVNGHHFALSHIFVDMIKNNQHSVASFKSILKAGITHDNHYWFKRKPSKTKDPKWESFKEAGHATMMSGQSNYNKLADTLFKDWSVEFHSNEDLVVEM